MVHQYQLLNQNIVLDTCSGGVYSVDKMAYDTIKIFNEQTKEQITAAVTVALNISSKRVFVTKLS